MLRSFFLALSALVMALPAVGFTATAQAQDEVVLYSGRGRSLIEPLVEKFQEQTGIQVKVRYAKDAQLLASLEEEGQYSPADVYWANTVGPLGAAAKAGLLSKLPDSIMDQPDAFTPSSKLWTPVTVRFRVLAYNPNKISKDQLPKSVMDFPEAFKDFKGRVGWTPPYSSFQDFLTAMRVTQGPEKTRQWIDQMKQLDPKAWASNTPMLQAMLAGEIDVALTNHYYVYRLKYGGEEGEYEGHEEGEEGEHGESEEEEAEERGGHPNAPVEIYHFESGDVGNLALVTGAGLLKSAKHPEAGKKFINYLLNHEFQSFAAHAVHEYPVKEDVKLPDYMTPMSRVLKLSPELDFDKLRDIEATLKMMREQGLF